MTVGDYDIDLDTLRSQRRGDARFAQRFLYHMGPRDAPLLPLSNLQYRQLILSRVGIKQITAWYARSLAVFEYDVFEHPDLEVFGSGVMASPFGPEHILSDAGLKQRFSPQVLGGLDPGLIWSPLKGQVQGQKISKWPSPNSRAANPRIRRSR